MKSIKIFFLATVAIVAGLFTACSDDDFKAGPEVDGAQVYFPENVTTQHSISDDVSSIAIPVKRIAKDEALTVAVLASDESGLFTIPSSVSFAAGKETSELLITFDRTKLEDGKEYPLSFLSPSIAATRRKWSCRVSSRESSTEILLMEIMKSPCPRAGKVRW